MNEIDFSKKGDKGFFIDGVTHLSPTEALEMVGRGAVIVDLREDYETNYRVFDVPNIVYMPKSQFAQNFTGLPKDMPLILSDAIGLWSKEAIRMLRAAGYANLANLSGGVIDWEKDGLPLRKDKDYELSGQCSCKLRSRKGGNPLKKRDDAGLK